MSMWVSRVTTRSWISWARAVMASSGFVGRGGVVAGGAGGDGEGEGEGGEGADVHVGCSGAAGGDGWAAAQDRGWMGGWHPTGTGTRGGAVP